MRNVYDLGQPVARYLAGLIEERVFELGYRLLSKPFIAELVHNEVLAWGLLFERTGAIARRRSKDRTPLRAAGPQGGLGFRRRSLAVSVKCHVKLAPVRVRGADGWEP